MIKQGASMKNKGRAASLSMLVLFLLPTLLAGQAGAYHASRGTDSTAGDQANDRVADNPLPQPKPPREVPEVPLPLELPSSVPIPHPDDVVRDALPDTNPTVDHVRDTILDTQRDALDRLRQELINRNASIESLAPSVARVIEDHVDADRRIGGVGPWKSFGGGWRVASGVGYQESNAFTMTDPKTGTYGTMDSWLISPALDLSAYVLQTGTMPFVGGNFDELAYSICNARSDNTCVSTGIDFRYVQDMINLIFRHRHNLLEGQDGGQVYIFTKEPQPGDKGKLLQPIRLYGEYSESDVVGLDGPGYTGYADWNVTAFDITAYAGKTVWIGFRVATSPRASADPDNYFRPGSFPSEEPYGWIIDDIEVFAPAYGRNLKVYSVDGPSYRTDSKDRIDRVPPGALTHVGATVLNAGAGVSTAVVNLTVRGLDGDDVSRTFTRRLESGEVWNVTIPVVAPMANNSIFTVEARVAQSPTFGNTAIVDANGNDDVGRRDFKSSLVARFAATVTPAEIMVDDNADQTATATVQNTGNVPLTTTVHLLETYNATNQTSGVRDIPRSVNHGTQEVSIAPGETATVNFTVTTGDRGPHRLLLTAAATGAGVQSDEAVYYVHASPPPAYAASVAEGTTGDWTRYLSHMPIEPLDDWTWRSNGSLPGRVLRATPLPEVVANATSYTDLKLKVRYFSLVSDAILSISYTQPASLVVSGIDGRTDYSTRDVWSMDLHAPNPSSYMEKVVSSTWITIETDVVPNESTGYNSNLWSLNGLELRVRTTDKFYLDDVRLTGVPAGKDEAFRTEIIRITGNDSLSNVNFIEEQGTVGPAQPHTNNLLGRCVAATSAKENCWDRLNTSNLWENVSDTRWMLRPADSPDVLLKYGGRGDDDSDRLVTPPIKLEAATDPLLILDHSYAFQAFPYDGPPSTYAHSIRQIGIVELQYLRPDGAWSDFQRIVPIGDYPRHLEMSEDQNTRTRANFDGQAYDDGFGFTWPTRCVKTATAAPCDNGGFVYTLSKGVLWYTLYEPTPYPAVDTFRLRDAIPGVNLTNSVIRVAFHASQVSDHTAAVELAQWNINEVRVTPVSRFAIDAAVARITLDTAYNWTRTGVAPGTDVPVNVTIRNEGIFRDEFNVRLGVAPAGRGGHLFGDNVSIGALEPGEARSVIILWNVSPLEDGYYDIVAEVVPTDNRSKDDDRFDDRAEIRSIRAITVEDVAVSVTAFPLQGDRDLQRYLPVTLFNHGNVPISGIQVERTVEFLAGGRITIKDHQVYEISEDLEPGPSGTSLLAVSNARDSHVTYTPDEYGTYLVTTRIREGDEPFASDANKDDNEARVFLEAAEPLYSEAFEFKDRWHTDRPDVWGGGSGFRSQSSLTAANRTTGLIPANTDASVVSPRIAAIANARTAVINFVTRYDLEKGYDGGVVEISADNRTWHRAGILDPYGRTVGYPERVSNSNILAAGSPMDAVVTAFSGDSTTLPAHEQGWAPVSIDLASIPGFAEEVIFKTLPAPTRGSGHLETAVPPGERIVSAPWMQLDSGDEENRWEIRNEMYNKGEPRWWSGYVQATPLMRTLSRTFNFGGLPDDSAIVVSWWDRRPGTTQGDWRGVGGDYIFRAQAPVPSGAGATINWAPEHRIQPIARQNDWTRLQAVLTPDAPNQVQIRFDMNTSRTVNGQTTTPLITAPNYGWEVRGITVEAYPAINGTPIPGSRPIRTFTLDERDPAERANWNAGPWQWLAIDGSRTPAHHAPWDVIVDKNPESLDTSLWKLNLNTTTRANVDTRLVTPIIDLSQVSGGRTFLRVTHKYDLLWQEDPQPRSTKFSENKHYQAGTVEILVYNRSTGEWDPPKQLFTDPVGPSEERKMRPDVNKHVTDAAPYPRTLADAGDTFQRYPRTLNQRLSDVTGNAVYFRPRDFNMSYVYSGNSKDIPGNDNGWLTHEFDLAQYRGEKVRIAFHAWSTPFDLQDRDRHWTIGSTEVIGNVLSAKDVYVRLRLGTDDSNLGGSWSMDQFEITGRRYVESLGLHLSETPTAVGTGSSTVLGGTIQNYGGGVRDLIAIGVQIKAPIGAPALTIVPDGPGIVPPPGYDALMGPFRLDSAGTPGSIVPFQFHVHAGALPAGYSIRLVLLEAEPVLGDLTFEPLRLDDVPGRTRREVNLVVEDRLEARIDALTVAPSALVLPGQASATVRGVNVGTRDLHLAAVFTWRNNLDGREVASHTVPAGSEDPRLRVAPGQPFSIDSPPVNLASVGNYTLTVRLVNAGGSLATPAVASRFYRVGTSDVAYSTSFENGFNGWTPVDDQFNGWKVVSDEARFGGFSVLLGVDNGAYSRGVRAEDDARMQGAPTLSGVLQSPVIDLRSALPDFALTFWFKSKLGGQSNLGMVNVVARPVNEDGNPISGCGWRLLFPDPAVRLNGLQADWSYARMPLDVPADDACALIGKRMLIQFQLSAITDQGWRLDGVTVAGGDLAVTPAERYHEVADGSRKVYQYRVENKGTTPRDLVMGFDKNASRTTPEQEKWVEVTPSTLRLQPGESRLVTVSIDTPAARGLFRQPVNVSVGLYDAVRPFVQNLTKLHLDFKPDLRADLAATASIDGKPLGAVRVSIEEGTPHEVGILVSNLGNIPSNPTDVHVRIVNASGGVIWELRERIDGLLPVNDGGEAILVAGTWKPLFGKRGNHTLLVTIDPERQQVDYDRSNGDVALPIAVTPLVRPDLVVDAKSLQASTPNGVRLHEAVPGQLVRISALVRNDGLADAKQVSIRVIAGSTVLKEELVPLLKVGESYLVSTNQIAPANTTTYQIVAITPDIEILPDNNAQVLELPILPPELVVSLPDAPIRIDPGAPLQVTLNVTNTAPYPTVVNLSMGPGARFVSLATTRLALGPGESRSIVLHVEPGARELAGEWTAMVVAENTEGVKARRTVTIDVNAHPGASVVPYLARGAPQNVRIELDAVNTGNVEIRPHAVLLDSAGNVLSRKELPPVPPGRARFAAISLALPDATPPGPLNATLRLEADGMVPVDQNLVIDVQPWGRLVARAEPISGPDGQQTVTINVAYDGNAPTTRQPVLLNAPPGVVARYSDESLILSPGESRSVTLRVAAPKNAPAGLYLLQAGFVDPAEPGALAGNLTSIPLDLRRARIDLVNAERVGGIPAGGSAVDYVARVRNVGDSVALQVPVDLYVDGALVDREVLDELAPGQQVEVRLTWTAQSGSHSIVLAADPHGADADTRLAFAETLQVEKGAIEGVAGLSQVPGPTPLLLLAALGVAALALRRRGRLP